MNENTAAASDLAIRFAQAVGCRTGIQIPPSEVERVWGVVCSRVLREAGVTPLRLLDEVESPGSDASIRGLILESVVNGESYFFRDPGLFELLRLQIGPELFARRAEVRALRIWSAGCSTGEEPYSLAATFQQAAPPGWAIRVNATDLSPLALEHARRGVYRDWSLRGLQPTVAGLERLPGGGWRVPNQWQTAVDFHEANIFDPPLDECLHSDLVICRNVLIYFSEESRTAALERLESAVAPGGYLILGHAECIGYRPAGFELRVVPQGVYWRRRAEPGPVDPTPPAVRRSALPSSPRRTRHESKASQFVANGEAPLPVGDSMAPTPRCRAEALADGGDYASALAACEAILDREPFDLGARMLQARVSLAMGRPALARDVLLGVVYLNPSEIAAYVELVHVAGLLGDSGRRSWAAGRAGELLAAVAADASVPHLPGYSAGRLLTELQQVTGASE